jgi:hypothetical protein
MNIYTVVIFLPTHGWRPKLLEVFISWGWKISAAVIDNNPGLHCRKASSALDFLIECDIFEETEIRKRIENKLNELEIYWFGLIIKNNKNGALCWSASNSEFKKES